ncbi:hypothetical protein AKJ16_DCAP11403 [Drosera capensis]
MSGLLRGEPLLSKLAMVAKFVVFPGAMIASLVYSPPDYSKPKKSLDSAADMSATLIIMANVTDARRSL